MIRKNVLQVTTIFCLILFGLGNISVVFAGWEQEHRPNLDTSCESIVVTEEAQSVETLSNEVLELLNIERANVGLAPLMVSEEITLLSNIRAYESSVLFSHMRPNGWSCSSLFQDYKIQYSCVGENLAFGYEDASDMVNAWMNSKYHCENILNQNFEYCGIGFYQNENEVIYCSLLFYTPQT